jgi:hypothetical protein
MPTLWERKPNSPDYVIVTTDKVWGQVKEKWSSLGSPDAMCPSPKYGQPGSAQNDACRSAVGPIWDRFEETIPDLPATAPHYSISDVVPVEEVCALGYSEDPEADIGPPVNLFENPGALAQKLQEWYLRSLIPSLCQPVESPPLEGGCFCWPYFVKAKFEVRRYLSGEWEEVEARTAVYGPFRGQGWDYVEPEAGGFPGVNVYVRGQENVGGFKTGGLDTCTLGTQKYPLFGGFGYDQARAITILEVVPFTIADIDFYGLSGSVGFLPTSEFCPTPQGLPPLNDYPNTRPVYMPEPIPVFRFPAAPGCPLGEEDYMIFTVNVEGAVGPPGPPGVDGKEGKDGPTMIRRIEAIQQPLKLGETDVGAGELGGSYSIPRGCAAVEVKFKVPFVEEDLVRERRVFFDPPEGGNFRVEGSWGNAHLVMSGAEQGSLERIQFSRLVTSIYVPELPDSRNWTLVVVDKGDQGIEVWDTGLRHVLRKVGNIDDIPSYDYQGE